MTNLYLFKAQAQLAADQNLLAFIALARDKVQLWDGLDGFGWANNSWPTHTDSLRFLSRRYSGLHGSAPVLPKHVLSAPFLEFAKAYMRYSQHLRLTKTFKRAYAALQFLELALIDAEGNADVTKTSERHLDLAVEYLQASGLKDRGGIAGALATLAESLSCWRIATSSIRYWKPPVFRALSDGDRSDPSVASKLPNNDALLALAEIFSNGYSQKQDDEDVFITSLTCLFLSAPMRISEMLHFGVKLIDTELDKYGDEQVFFSYWSPKTGQYVRKEIPGVMAHHAVDAVRRIREITEESRNLARHYESGSNHFYRHANCPEVPNDQVLTRAQVAEALGVKSTGSAESLLLASTGKYTLRGYTLNSLWQVVLGIHRRKNPYFPYQIDPLDTSSGKPLKMSESLICFRHQQLSTRNVTSPVLLAPANRDYFSKRLDVAENAKGGKRTTQNLFRKHGFESFALRSHQMRHFLNTLAQEAGVGIDAITQWSTRASNSQTRTYMHQSSDEKSEAISEKMGLSSIGGEAPITEQEYRLMDYGPIITTRYGVCTHDYTITPCNKHADCINCSELLMCKGHKKSIDALRIERDRVAENMAASKAAIDSGKRVAGRWHAAHEVTLERLNQVLAVMSDPAIEGGSAIRMVGRDFTHESRILNSSAEDEVQLVAAGVNFELEYSDGVAECFKMLQEESDG